MRKTQVVVVFLGVEFDSIAATVFCTSETLLNLEFAT